VRRQWSSLRPELRAVLVVVPALVVVILLLVDVVIGATIAVLLGGAAVTTAMYVKNRTDRHNAAVDRGEIATGPDLHFVDADSTALGPLEQDALAQLGIRPGDVGRVTKFEGGWIVRRRNPRDVAAVIGPDGGMDQFDRHRH
jgi:hypothetical protein